MQFVVREDTDLDRLTQNFVLKRLYEYWMTRRGSFAFPARDQIDPTEFSFALGQVSLVEVLDDPRRYRYRLVSTTLTDHLGYEMTGKYVEDIPEREARDYVRTLYAQAVDLRVPLYEKDQRIFDGRQWEHEALLLPLSSDGANVNMLLVYRQTTKPEPVTADDTRSITTGA